MRRSGLFAAVMAAAVSAPVMGTSQNGPVVMAPRSPRGHGSHRSNKPTLDREKRDRRNRIAKLSRRRNRGR